RLPAPALGLRQLLRLLPAAYGAGLLPLHRPTFTPFVLGWLLPAPLRALLQRLQTMCGARRIVAEPAPLTNSQRLRICDAGGRPDLLPGLANLGRERADGVALAQFLGTHLNGARNVDGACQHARTNLVAAQRPPDHGGNERRRNARVDRVVPVAER